ncbi:MAG: hypothetical protein HQL71_14390 [Magnetococcales bacterium]|nr:hypothetical protein [Magnetococcales bacterium]
MICYTKKAYNQQGSILVTIMVVMVLVMGLASALIEHFAVTEARAVEDSLAKIRVHWGMSGMVDYALSRAKATGDSISTTDGDDNDTDVTDSKISQINNFFDELDADTGDDDRIYRFIYDTNYMLDFTGKTSINTSNTGNDGRLFFTISLDTIPTPSAPSISNLNSRINDLTVDFCIASTGAILSTSCTVLATNEGDSNIISYTRF